MYATAELPPHEDDPIFLPHLQGERTPYLDPTMRGAWVRLSPRHDRSRLLRAALEGVAFAVGDAVHALLDASPVDHLRLAGGGSGHPGWRQLLADVLGLPLQAVDVSAASGRGAALLGAQAADLMNEHEALTRLTPATELVASPQPESVHHYNRRRSNYLKTVHALQQVSPPPEGANRPDPTERDDTTPREDVNP